MEKYSKHILRVEKIGTFGDIVSQVDIQHLNKKGVNLRFDGLSKKYPPNEFNIIEMKSNKDFRIF